MGCSRLGMDHFVLVRSLSDIWYAPLQRLSQQFSPPRIITPSVGQQQNHLGNNSAFRLGERLVLRLVHW